MKDTVAAAIGRIQKFLNLKEKLSWKIALMVVAIALSLCAVMITASYYNYRSQVLENYRTRAMSIAAIAAEHIDPDRILQYLDRHERESAYDPQKDEAYLTDLNALREIQNALFQMREDLKEDNGHFQYIYVVYPTLEEPIYIMDADPGDPWSLGESEPWTDGFKKYVGNMTRGEYIKELLETNPSENKGEWLVSVYYPLRASTGERAGYIGVDMNMTSVKEDLFHYALRMSLIMAVMTVILTAIFILITSRIIAQPIRKLSHAAKRMVEEEETGQELKASVFSNIVIHSNDEIGILYQNLKQMEVDIHKYIRDLMRVTTEKERYSTELNVATQIQTNVLPNIFPPYPERSEFDIFATMNPAKEVGGDFYDFFLVDDDHLAMVMADVSGKGVPAALFMMIARTLIKNHVKRADHLSEIFSNVNKQLCEENEESMFVTVWLGVLELSTGILREINAGHENPAIRRADGRYEFRKCKHSLALGMREGARFREEQFQLHPGDGLYIYTDGVTEAENVQGELFATDRLLDVLNQNPSAPPKELLYTVKKAIDTFAGEAEQCDDITMLGLHYFGPLMSPEILRLAKTWLEKEDNQTRMESAKS